MTDEEALRRMKEKLHARAGEFAHAVERTFAGNDWHWTTGQGNEVPCSVRIEQHVHQLINDLEPIEQGSRETSIECGRIIVTVRCYVDDGEPKGWEGQILLKPAYSCRVDERDGIL